MMGYWNQGILERRGQGQELGNCSFTDSDPSPLSSLGLLLPMTTDKELSLFPVENSPLRIAGVSEHLSS